MNYLKNILHLIFLTFLIILPQISNAFEFTQEERTYIEANPNIPFTCDPNWLPFEAFTPKGKVIGMLAEHLNIVESDTKLNFLPVKVSTWSESLQTAMTGKVKVISGDAADAILNQNFNSIETYGFHPIVIIMNQKQNYVETLDKIQDKRIAIIKDYGYTAALYEKYPDIKFHEVENIQDGLNGVATGEFDAMLATMALATYTMTQMQLHNIKVVGKTDIVMELTLFVDKNEPILYNIINKSVKNITAKQKQLISQKWLKHAYVEKIDYTMTIIITFFSLLIIILLMFWIRSSNRNVKKLENAQKALQESENLLSTVINEIPDVLIVKDYQGNFLLGNKVVADLYNTTPGEMIGKHDEDFGVPKDIADSFRTNVISIMDKGISEIVYENSKDAKTGKLHHFKSIKKPFKNSQDQNQILVIAHDVTDLKESTEALEKNKKYMEVLFNISLSLINLSLVKIDEEINEALKRMAIFSRAERAYIFKYNFLSGTTSNTYEWCQEGTKPQISELQNIPLDAIPQWVEKHKNGNYMHIPDVLGLSEDTLKEILEPQGIKSLLALPLMSQNECIGFIGFDRCTIQESFSDEDIRLLKLFAEILVNVKSRLKIENELIEQKNILDHQAHHDSLTSLPNRNLFHDRLEQSIEKAKRNKSKVGLLFIDLDHFKEINDSLGHDVGDEILKLVTTRLEATTRDSDTLARLGGDEFTMIIEELNQTQDVSSIANKILQSLSRPMNIHDNILYVSSSIGISIYPDDSKTPMNLLKYADSAMYKAKDEGRNNFQYYNSELTELAFQRINMESSLRSAIENEEFIVYYQPQVEGKTNTLVGLEALVRWEHPTMGLIPPSKFISLAESTGLIVDIDTYVMTTAMKQVSNWYKQGLNPGRLAMNLTLKQLHQKGFVEIFRIMMEETHCKAKWVELELTEGQVMTHPEEAIRILKSIKDLGVELAIDDFGTGYSSLEYLKRLPINKLKIDQVFIKDLPGDDEDEGITKAIIALANSLNLKVIAEGVETEAQKDFVVKNGCNNIQGYFYSRPLPADKLEKLLRDGF